MNICVGSPACRSPEKPWYTPMITEFLVRDVPRLLDIPQQLVARDVDTLERRLANEGESFLTKTLPALGKSIDLALQGHVSLRTHLFKKRGRTALPSFLSALLGRVFKDDGWVRDVPCLTSISLLRQITFWCKKLKKGYSDESLQKAAEDFIEIDGALPTLDHKFGSMGGLLDVARAVIERMFRNIGDVREFRPKHGPGAVAGGEGIIGKRSLSVAYAQLERVFRPIPWFRSLRDAAESPSVVYDRERQAYGLSRLEFVEKDSSGPRTIGLEPAEYMWIQQCIKAWMYNHIENTRQIARGHVNFTDQTINRELAREWWRYDTLDMSKASDRNSYALVKALFEHTRLWPYLDTSRTIGTVMPDGRTLIYRKFAPMGSAVCFPVQACVYFALAVAAQHLAGMPLLLACRNTYVYGDDLIVLSGNFQAINSAFEKVGLVFNMDKCCTHGRFRESCGMDAFEGVEVMPLRFRLSDVSQRADLAKLVEHSNSLMEAGYWFAGLKLRSLAQTRFSHFNVRFPLSDTTDLPIITWRVAPWESPTVVFRPVKNWRRKPKVGPYRVEDLYTGLTFVEGWCYKPTRLQARRKDEGLYLRESLCHGGPVGEFLHDTPKVGPPEFVRRNLAAKYSGDLLKKRFTVVREYSRFVDMPTIHRRQSGRRTCSKAA